MRQLALAFVILSLPAFAQVAPDGPEAGTPDDMEEGVDLLQRGMESILRGFMTEMQPALNDMGRALSEMKPMADELLKLMDNIGNYEVPEIQPNGDILIRRKPAVPELPKEGEIDL